MKKELEKIVDAYKAKLKQLDGMFFAIEPKLEQVLTKGNYRRIKKQKEELYCKVIAIAYVLSLSIAIDNVSTLNKDKCAEIEMRLDEYKNFIEKIKTKYLDVIVDKTPLQKTR